MNNAGQGPDGELLTVFDGDPEAEAIMREFREKIPSLNISSDNAQLVEQLRYKIEDVLAICPDSPQKKAVVGIIVNAIATCFASFGIKYRELIVIPEKMVGRMIMRASFAKIEKIKLNYLYIDPSRIISKIDLLVQFGLPVSLNITDILFVIVHEIAHMAQFLHAEDAVYKSMRFEYEKSPRELHSDEVALDYCRKLFNSLCGHGENKGCAKDILLSGLPMTIKRAEMYGRPI
ncbi:MAG: hypothetical protein UT33_C0013G0012 [Candidatus Peregrinibacteria bacterium GW2011_GWC2_39_14]|nr:MAG: hypothetical protein US92_C0007G0064 [Candidatus Peregrinibacteria bacterium GW2011_GWA2_38_36]KKR05160.1 MAG: hypothetical protein UT33_C0013G0012 [Candidatus Peregrinibacteria bacterium GW2011_GWC2_39_14]